MSARTNLEAAQAKHAEAAARLSAAATRAADLAATLPAAEAKRTEATNAHFDLLGRADTTGKQLVAAKLAVDEASREYADHEAAARSSAQRRDALGVELQNATADRERARAALATELMDAALPTLREQWRATLDMHRAYVILAREAGRETRSGTVPNLGRDDEPGSIRSMRRAANLAESWGVDHGTPRLTIPQLLALSKES